MLRNRLSGGVLSCLFTRTEGDEGLKISGVVWCVGAREGGHERRRVVRADRDIWKYDVEVKEGREE